MRERFIYGLRDPVTKEIRYVGKSSTGMRRPRQHANLTVMEKEDTHKARWIRALFVSDLAPEIVILQRVTAVDDINEAEMYWVALGRAALGDRLTNSTDGGDGGTPGRKLALTDEQRAKRSRTQKIVQNLPDVAARRNAAIRAACSTPEFSARVSAAQREILNRPGVLEKKRATGREILSRQGLKDAQLQAMRETYKKPEMRAKMSRVALEVQNRPEVKAKQRAAQLVAQNRPAVKAKVLASLHEYWSNPDNHVAARIRGVRAAATRKANRDARLPALSFGSEVTE